MARASVIGFGVVFAGVAAGAVAGTVYGFLTTDSGDMFRELDVFGDAMIGGIVGGVLAACAYVINRMTRAR